MTLPQLELAARHYCYLAQIDPEEQLKLAKPVPGVNGPVNSIPRWQAIGNALLDQHRVNEAIRIGLESPAEPSQIKA